MAPNANLEELRTLAKRVLAGYSEPIESRQPDRQSDAERLAELTQALDGWLSRGGFLPRAWGVRNGPECP